MYKHNKKYVLKKNIFLLDYFEILLYGLYINVVYICYKQNPQGFSY